MNPTVYELHAGSSNKRPPEYIFLENGNTLRDVMNACKDASLGKLEETLSKAVGPFMKKSRFCLNCRGICYIILINNSVLLGFFLLMLLQTIKQNIYFLIIGSFPELGTGKTMVLCNSCMGLKDSKQDLLLESKQDSQQELKLSSPMTTDVVVG